MPPIFDEDELQNADGLDVVDLDMPSQQSQGSKQKTGTTF